MHESPPQKTILSRKQLTLHATRPTPRGASRLVRAMFAWSVKARRAPSRHCKDARVHGHTTTVKHDMITPHPPLVAGAPFALVFASVLCQLWVVFKRYREFVALRQLLKTSCQQMKNPASSTSRSKSPARAKRPFAAGSGLGMGFVAGGGSGGGGESRAGSGNIVANRASAERIEKVLSTFRFPNKLAIGRSVALREERREAINAFLVALVSGT